MCAEQETFFRVVLENAGSFGVGNKEDKNKGKLRVWIKHRLGAKRLLSGKILDFGAKVAQSEPQLCPLLVR